MATLPTNFQDDVLDVTQNENRKYNMIQNQDGTVSFEDVTEYVQQGSQFGAQNVNAQNTEINALNSNLTTNNGTNDVPFRFGYDLATGKYGYILNEGGADTVHPFKSGSKVAKVTVYADASGYGVRVNDSNTVAYWTSMTLYDEDDNVITSGVGGGNIWSSYTYLPFATISDFCRFESNAGQRGTRVYALTDIIVDGNSIPRGSYSAPCTGRTITVTRA